MKHLFSRSLALALAIATAFTLASCKEGSKKPADTKPPKPEISAEEVYESAKEKLSALEDLSQEFTVRTEREISGEVFTEEMTSTSTYVGRGGDSLKARFNEKYVYGGEDNSYSAVTTFADDKVYYQIEGEDGRAYVCEMDSDDYLEVCVPPALFESENYEKISFADGDDGTILFEKAKEPEEWALGERCKLLSASGSATLSEDGNISKMTYTVSYTQGPASVTAEYLCEIKDCTASAEDITAPDEKICLPVSTLSIPAIIKYAQHNAPLSAHTSGSASTVYYSQAAAHQIIDQKMYYAFDDGEDGLSAKIESSFLRTVEQNNYTQSETIEFADGKSTYTVDGHVLSQSFTEENVNELISEMRDGFIPSLFEMNSINASMTDDFLIISYTLDSTLGTSYEDTVSDKLFNSPDFLDGYATAYNTRGLGGYVAIDLDTYLPTAGAIEYMGTHVIEGQTVAVGMQSYYTFTAADLSAIEEITGEPLPEKKPEEGAAPLLYEVSDTAGHKMYLFGTIHVGDERTGALPEELYSALSESDALAVEFDITSLANDLSENEELAKVAANAMYYTDGSTIADHISPEVYSYAAELMKAVGMRFDTLMTRPSVWANQIDNFILSSSRTLDGECGADNRLLKLAGEKGMKILEVESAEKQLKMFSQYPDKTQELILASSLGTSRAEYVESLTELYELWCSGDEAALREAVNKETEIPEDATKEEIKAYEEYEKIMMSDRDTDMKKVAESYLSSGETVFYAVGLAHLLGDETGLVDTLRDAGYIVELVEYK